VAEEPTVIFSLASRVAIFTIALSTVPSFGIAIINGVVDTEHQAVGAVLTDNDRCTGTIITVDPPLGRVLTAAHCVDGSEVLVLVLGDDATSPSALLPIVETVMHPNYDPGTAGFDVAILTVSGVEANTPSLAVATPGLSIGVGASFEVIGYGLTAYPSGDTDFRHSLMMNVDDVYSQSFVADSSIGGPCSGDSGGPAVFLDGLEEKVAGVVSSTDATCSIFALFANVPSVYASFILPAISTDELIFADTFETADTSIWSTPISRTPD
jgi:hypothetical protein